MHSIYATEGRGFFVYGRTFLRICIEVILNRLLQTFCKSFQSKVPIIIVSAISPGVQEEPLPIVFVSHRSGFGQITKNDIISDVL